MPVGVAGQAAAESPQEPKAATGATPDMSYVGSQPHFSVHRYHRGFVELSILLDDDDALNIAADLREGPEHRVYRSITLPLPDWDAATLADMLEGVAWA